MDIFKLPPAKFLIYGITAMAFLLPGFTMGHLGNLFDRFNSELLLLVFMIFFSLPSFFSSYVSYFAFNKKISDDLKTLNRVSTVVLICVMTTTVIDILFNPNWNIKYLFGILFLLPIPLHFLDRNDN